MEQPTADAILAAVAQAYSSLANYEDAGVVTGAAVATVRFETQFRRGSLLRFKYVATFKDGRTFHEGEVALDCGVLSFRCSLPAAPQPASLRHGVGALTGISNGAAHVIPALLLPEDIGGWLPTDLQNSTRLPDVVVRGHPCFHVQGQHPKQGGRSSLIVDKTSYLLHQRVSGTETTDYESFQAT